MNTRSNIEQNLLLIKTIKSPLAELEMSLADIEMASQVKPSIENFILNTDLYDFSPTKEDLLLADKFGTISPSKEKVVSLGKDTAQSHKKTSNIQKNRNGKKEEKSKSIPALKRKVTVEVVEDSNVVVGTWSKVLLKIVDSDKKDVTGFDMDIKMVSNNNAVDKGFVSSTCHVKHKKNYTEVRFVPFRVGPCMFVVSSKSKTFDETAFNVEVYGNNPKMSFSESENDWPVTLAYRMDDRCVYVAFNHHVSKFSENGDFRKVVLRAHKCFINDLAVHPSKLRLAVGVSEWIKTRGYSIRSQEARLYSMMGTHLWTVGKQYPLFDVPVLHVAFDGEGHVIIAGHKFVGVCNRITGDIKRNIMLDKLVTPSRLSSTPDGGYAIADAAKGTIQMYDKNWALKNEIVMKNPCGNPMQGVTGLAVDIYGNVIVSSCTREEIYVYDKHGKLRTIIESDWDFARYPLDVTTTHDGYLFVADHGNACTKKYKYL